jgi:ATP-dependent RNA helicase DeaD
MSAPILATVLEPALAAAFERKGYGELTPVQAKVLDPTLAGRDLRITSQTGSGKTIAIGLALRAEIAEPSPSKKGVARPRAIVVAPTRELARQVEEELTWLYEGLGARVASTTGGASFRDEHRALAAGPAVVVGTPGRLLDHLNRKSVDPAEVSAIVLDEADRMLDLGFREELEAILESLPGEHRTHLVSATFPRDVRALADRVQSDAAHVEGTRLGSANTDIKHVIHLVHPREKLGAIVNLLLATPDAQTLIFARTRADVADIAEELDKAGFRVGALSGELEQAARNRALSAFKRGDMRALVATDVAARGIDVQDIARVIHVDVPTNADAYTHRSGRTGRAGRQGTSSLLVPPAALKQAVRILARAGVAHTIEPMPSAEAIRRAADDRLFAELTRAADDAEAAMDERTTALAARLVEGGDVVRTVGRLLLRARGPERTEPRDLTPIAPQQNRPSDDRRPRAGAPREDTRERRPRAARADSPEDWVRFRVTWGEGQGADSRRLLAMVCRRGAIEGKAVGAIRVERDYSVVNVATSEAPGFARLAAKPDPRDPRIRIELYRDHPPARTGAAPKGTAQAAHEKPKARGADGRPRFDGPGKRAPARDHNSRKFKATRDKR